MWFIGISIQSMWMCQFTWMYHLRCASVYFQYQREIHTPRSNPLFFLHEHMPANLHVHRCVHVKQKAPVWTEVCGVCINSHVACYMLFPTRVLEYRIVYMCILRDFIWRRREWDKMKERWDQHRWKQTSRQPKTSVFYSVTGAVCPANCWIRKKKPFYTWRIDLSKIYTIWLVV